MQEGSSQERSIVSTLKSLASVVYAKAGLQYAVSNDQDSPHLNEMTGRITRVCAFHRYPYATQACLPMTWKTQGSFEVNRLFQRW